MDYTNLKSLTIPEGKVIKILRDGVLLWNKYRLPVEYREVEWIGTDGNSYFVSNFDINNLDNFTIYYRSLVPKSGNRFMFGSNGRASGSISAPRFLDRYAGMVISPPSGSNYAVNFSNDNIFHNYRMSIISNGQAKFYMDDKLITEGTFGNSRTFYSIGVFCNNYNQQPSSYKAQVGSKIAELRFVDNTTGKDVFNPIPCYRISDGVIGMYDLASNIFYTNAGSGSFTKGPSID